MKITKYLQQHFTVSVRAKTNEFDVNSNQIKGRTNSANKYYLFYYYRIL